MYSFLAAPTRILLIVDVTTMASKGFLENSSFVWICTVVPRCKRQCCGAMLGLATLFSGQWKALGALSMQQRRIGL